MEKGKLTICVNVFKRAININNNIISKRWEERYAKLSKEVKEKLEIFDNLDISEYQLQVIKRKRIYPEKGDVFQIKPAKNIDLYGIVINNHINNINGEDLILIMIFKQKENIEISINLSNRMDNSLLD